RAHIRFFVPCGLFRVFEVVVANEGQSIEHFHHMSDVVTSPMALTSKGGGERTQRRCSNVGGAGVRIGFVWQRAAEQLIIGSSGQRAGLKGASGLAFL